MNVEERDQEQYQLARTVVEDWVEHFAWYATQNWQRRMVEVAVAEKLDCVFEMAQSRSGGGQQWLAAMAGLYSRVVAKEYV